MIRFFSYLKLPLSFILLAMSIASTSQSLQYLNSNNVNAGIGIGGNLFTKWDSMQIGSVGLFESPKGSGISAIYSQALWLTGADSFGNVHCAANQYSSYGLDFFDGPIVANYDSIYDR